MDSFKKKFNSYIFYLKSKIHVVNLIISLISFVFIFSNIIKLNVIIGISKLFYLNILFQELIILSTIYVILFLPTYPIFFVIYKDMHFTNLEKLNLTIIINLSFYILAGYIGYFLGFDITAIFYFFTLLICYLSIVLYIIIQEFKNHNYTFLKVSKKINKESKWFKEFSLANYIKGLLSTNGILLIIFLFLICILNVVRFTYFFGTDPWLHMFIIKSIVKMRYLPLEEYYGSVGLPIFGAVIHFFSGVDIILIPKWFVFYTILVSALVFYNIMMKIFLEYLF